jgi:hypothetical protein
MVTIATLSVGCRFGTSPDRAVGLELEPAELNTVVGLSIPIAVIVVRADGTRFPVPPRSATFRSSNQSVARMATDSAGLVVITGQGQAEIGVTVTVDGRRLAKVLPVKVGFVIPPGD